MGIFLWAFMGLMFFLCIIGIFVWSLVRAASWLWKVVH